jgi:hypothetical protein
VLSARHLRARSKPNVITVARMGRLRGLEGVGAATVALGAVLSGCAGPGTAAPTGAVDAFVTAVSDGDGPRPPTTSSRTPNRLIAFEGVVGV